MGDMADVIKRFWKNVDKTSGPIIYKHLGRCWIWTGCKDGDGYGIFGHNNRYSKAHRFLAKEIYGLEIKDKLVCHKCDNPSCIRTSHIFVGTAKDNNDDKVRKGRQAKGLKHSEKIKEVVLRGDNHPARKNPGYLLRGDKHFSRKNPEKCARGKNHGRYTKPERTPRGEKVVWSVLTEEIVKEVRIRHKLGGKGNTTASLAREFNVAWSTMDSAIKGTSWKHVGENICL